MGSGPKIIYTVQVRELVEFALRRGDLGGEGDFASPSRARAGTRGHQRLQRSRAEGYEKEVAVAHDMETPELILRIQGRIDGLRASPGELWMEEIKTVRGAWRGRPDPLHWAQLRIYAFIYLQEHPADRLTLQLTYLNLDTDASTEFQEAPPPDTLATFFGAAAEVYLGWVQDWHRWTIQRNQSIQAMSFPFAVYREGQRALAVAAYRTLVQGGRLFLEAPTGIGKTISVLFPALKSLSEGHLKRVFYLTARTVGRTVAEKAIEDMRPAGLRLRSLTLTAKEKICFQGGQPCDAAACLFARGYYDRRHEAMKQALLEEAVTRPVVEAVARRHEVCPFELSLDISMWADVIVGDYNHLFDPQAYLKRHFSTEGEEHGFLIDEAHNLVDRAREMFSAALDSSEPQRVQRLVKQPLPRCARALGRLAQAMRKLGKSGGHDAKADEDEDKPAELDLFAADAAPGKEVMEGEGRPSSSGEAPRLLAPGLYLHPEAARILAPLVESALREAESWLGQNRPAPFREELLGLYFHMRSFLRATQVYDERYAALVEPGTGTRVRLFCLDPSRELRRALERGRAAVFFSATLTPVEYHRALLGGSPEDRVLQARSPFPQENLAVLVHDGIRTHFKSRQETLAQVAEAIGTLVSARRGNYLVYLPSYDYLKSVADQFKALYPQTDVLVQRSGMTEDERAAFLAAFSAAREETLVAFAVLGGVFGEGIDLVGERLIGVAVVGVGLPQICAERDLISQYFEDHNVSGFDYAYTFPGMNRVLQAAGRVIRTDTDRGVVLLIDTRFSQARHWQFFPPWWRPQRLRGAAVLESALRQFWLSRPEGR